MNNIKIMIIIFLDNIYTVMYPDDCQGRLGAEPDRISNPGRRVANIRLGH